MKAKSWWGFVQPKMYFHLQNLSALPMLNFSFQSDMNWVSYAVFFTKYFAHIWNCSHGYRSRTVYPWEQNSSGRIPMLQFLAQLDANWVSYVAFTQCVQIFCKYPITHSILASNWAKNWASEAHFEILFPTETVRERLPWEQFRNVAKYFVKNTA